jgi:hypothetical protein
MKMFLQVNMEVSEILNLVCFGVYSMLNIWHFLSEQTSLQIPPDTWPLIFLLGFFPGNEADFSAWMKTFWFNVDKSSSQSCCRDTTGTDDCRDCGEVRRFFFIS